MSVINQMLQDLEKRRGNSAEPELLGHVRAVDKANRDLLWKMIAVGSLVAVAVLTWLLLQIRQSPPVVAAPPVTAGIVTPKTETLPPPTVVPAAIIPEKLPEPIQATSPQQVVAVVTPTPVVVEEKVEPQNKPAEKPLDLDVRTQLAQPKSIRKADSSLKPIAKQQSKVKESKSAPLVVANKEMIEKRDRPITPQQRADEEFRKATLLLNQGRINESLQGFRNALNIDAQHEASRQALLGLLIESKQFNEAQKLLKDTLKNNPNQSSYAMVLARIQVDQSGLDTALETLKTYSSSAMNNADYHGFFAALYQRKGSHTQAIEHYQIALRLAPQTAVWMMGLGISLQSMQRYSEAQDTFRRAKASGNLTPDLMAFVDQRLSQLQHLSK